MITVNNEIKTETAQKQKWEQPQLIELNINETESGTLPLVELANATGNLLGS